MKFIVITKDSHEVHKEDANLKALADENTD